MGPRPAYNGPVPPSHTWSPITDLPTDYSSLTDGELAALTEVWKEQREELADTEALKTFQIRLHRRWAIETGVIEGAYTLDRGVTETLVLEGIDANLIRSASTNKDPDQVAAMIEDHLQVLEGLFTFIAGGRELTVSYIKELHAALLRHVPTHTVKDSLGNWSERELLKGVFKTHANNPSRPDGSVHQYCPPEHVDAEMDRLVQLHVEHVQRAVPPEIEAAWLHHAFTEIHPFADGNGRVARALASAVFLKAELFPVLITRDDKTYIPVLERADAGDLSDFVQMLVSGQRRAVVDAIHAIPSTQGGLGVESGSKPLRTVEEQIRAAREALLPGVRSTNRTKAEWMVAEERAAETSANVIFRLTDVASLLNAQIGGAGGWLFQASGQELHLIRKDSRDVIRTILQNGGDQFRGIYLVAMLYQRHGEQQIQLRDWFQINYRESPASLHSRFDKWLESGLADGIALWREQL
jgi:hypothetical protein